MIASVIVWKEQMIRRRDGSGEKEFRGAVLWSWARIWSREIGWKRVGLLSWVINSVFEGVIGLEGAGLDMSIEREGRDTERDRRLAWKEGDDGRELGGEASSAMVV